MTGWWGWLVARAAAAWSCFTVEFPPESIRLVGQRLVAPQFHCCHRLASGRLCVSVCVGLTFRLTVRLLSEPVPCMHVLMTRSRSAAAGHLSPPGSGPGHCHPPGGSPRAAAAAASTPAACPPAAAVVSPAAPAASSSRVGLRLGPTAAGHVAHQAPDKPAAVGQGVGQSGAETCRGFAGKAGPADAKPSQCGGKARAAAWRPGHAATACTAAGVPVP